MKRTARTGGVSAFLWSVALSGCHSALSIGGDGDAGRLDAADASSAEAPDTSSAGGDAIPSVEAGAILGFCLPGAAGACPSGSQCVPGCPYQPNSLRPIKGPGGLCSVPGRESCGCGIVPAPCTTPGLDCLMPACCDYEGLCVTPAEKATICAGPDAVRFACGP
jgi:hypothetical protein